MNVASKLQQHLGEVGISSITRQELAHLVNTSASKVTDDIAIERFLKAFRPLDYGIREAIIAGELSSKLTRSSYGNNCGVYDMQQAATAIAQGLTLLTVEEGNYTGISNLRISNWLLND